MSPQAGWYADPSGDTSRIRFWDGTQWTDQYMPNPNAPQGAGAPQAQKPYAYEEYVQNPPYEVPEQPSDAYQQAYQTASGGSYAPYSGGQMVMAPGQIYPMTETDRTLRLIAFIWNILCTIGCGVLLIPLAWMIPMTVHSYGIYKGTKPNSTGFDVCTLLFIGVVSGVLLLCSKKDV